MVRSARTFPATFAFVSLGCPKNLVDSERALAALTAAGLPLTDDPGEADAIVINTCGFIQDAVDESTEVIEQALALRREGSCRRVVVVGCLSQRFGPGDLLPLRQADALFGVLDAGTVKALVEYLRQELVGGPPAEEPGLDPFTRLRLTPHHFAYLRVSEGCENRCRYCVIPDIRGPLRSRPLDELVAEARHLVADGAVELCLVAEDTTSYGRDCSGQTELAALIRSLAAIDGLRWLRLLYTHPAHFTDELIETLAAEPKVCRYVDLPIQHAADRILASMGRGVTQAGIRRLIARLREVLPGLFLRTTVIVGFPGETEAHFQELLDFLSEVRFERLGAFAYSRERGTPAYDLPDQVPEEERERRRSAVMGLQQTIAFAFNSTLLGQRLAAIVDSPAPPGTSYWLGRTYGDAPDVDGMVYLSGDDLAPGDIWEVSIVGTRGYDLVGVAERPLSQGPRTGPPAPPETGSGRMDRRSG